MHGEAPSPSPTPSSSSVQTTTTTHVVAGDTDKVSSVAVLDVSPRKSADQSVVPQLRFIVTRACAKTGYTAAFSSRCYVTESGERHVCLCLDFYVLDSNRSDDPVHFSSSNGATEYQSYDASVMQCMREPEVQNLMLMYACAHAITAMTYACTVRSDGVESGERCCIVIRSAFSHTFCASLSFEVPWRKHTRVTVRVDADLMTQYTLLFSSLGTDGIEMAPLSAREIVARRDPVTNRVFTACESRLIDDEYARDFLLRHVSGVYTLLLAESARWRSLREHPSPNLRSQSLSSQYGRVNFVSELRGKTDDDDDDTDCDSGTCFGAVYLSTPDSSE